MWSVAKLFLALALLVAIMLLALCALSVSSPARAMQAMQYSECELAADVALVARALAEEQLPKETAGKVLLRIYSTTSERGRSALSAILDQAFATREDPPHFSDRIGVACQASGPGTVLGQRV